MRVYVGNLPYSATEEELRGLFEPFGQVVSVAVIQDKFSGRSKGFGFVEMADRGEGEGAIAQLNGNDWNGRALNVNEARPRTESSRGGYGGRDR